jgi:hypothetical protein
LDLEKSGNPVSDSRANKGEKWRKVSDPVKVCAVKFVDFEAAHSHTWVGELMDWLSPQTKNESAFSPPGKRSCSSTA